VNRGKSFEFRVVAQVNGRVHGIVDTAQIEGDLYAQHDQMWTSPMSGPEMCLTLECSFDVERMHLPEKDGMAIKCMEVEFSHDDIDNESLELLQLPLLNGTHLPLREWFCTLADS
jgi:hypothetical protein